MNIRSTAAACLLTALTAGTGLASDTGSETAAPLISTGITGSKTSSGLDDPTYVLKFRPVQRLVLDASAGPLDAGRIDSALVGTPVRRGDLLRLGLLREEGSRYRLNYLLLTVEDQQTIFRVADSLAKDLAQEFLKRKADFARTLEHYPVANCRQELAFDLVAGMLLNWEGLRLTTELGYRSAPRRWANGDVYLVHSYENGANLPEAGLYLDSQSFPGPKLCFSTFGDGVSLPRLKGIPDIFEGPAEEGLESLSKEPTVYAATRTALLVYITIALTDAGEVMDALTSGARSRNDLVARTKLPEARLDATLGLLQATGYVAGAAEDYRVAVPVLTERDKAVVDSSLALGRGILTAWLRQNYARMQTDLAGLSPMKSGLPFSLVFSEVWHYLFGLTAKALAEDGFFVNPRARGYRYDGYVPLVWAPSLHAMP